MRTKGNPKQIPIRCAYSKLVRVSELKPNPRNPNKHPDGQLDLYAKVLAKQGWRRPIVVSRRSGLVVTGHGAMQTAKRMGWDKVPVDCVIVCERLAWENDMECPRERVRHARRQR